MRESKESTKDLKVRELHQVRAGGNLRPAGTQCGLPDGSRLRVVWQESQQKTGREMGSGGFFGALFRTSRGGLCALKRW